MEKMCTNCIFEPYCYDIEFDRYADAMNLDGTCDSLITNEEYNKRVPCELGDYFIFNGELFQVNCLSYHKNQGIDDFFVWYNNTDNDMEWILASQCVFLTKEDAKKKLEELSNEKERT